MKITGIKFAIYCLVLLCVVSIPILNPIFFDKNYNEKTTYYFYTNLIDYEINNAKIINNGNASIVACNYNNCKEVKNYLNDIYGESIRISNYSLNTLNYVINKYQNQCQLIDTQYMGDYRIILLYDTSLPKFVNVDNKMVNIQIAISVDEINIGYPLILNGY